MRKSAYVFATASTLLVFGLIDASAGPAPLGRFANIDQGEQTILIASKQKGASSGIKKDDRWICWTGCKCGCKGSYRCNHPCP